MNARDARWFHRQGRSGLPLTGCDEFQARRTSPLLGMVAPGALARRAELGSTTGRRSRRTFLVLSGEALVIVEGQQRPLKQWDFVHCPPETQHVFVGAGDGPCVILAASSRQFQKDGPWGYYNRRRDCASLQRLSRRGDAGHRRRRSAPTTGGAGPVPRRPAAGLGQVRGAEACVWVTPRPGISLRDRLWHLGDAYGDWVSPAFERPVRAFCRWSG